MMTFKERLTLLWPNETIASISEKIGLSQMGLYKIFSKDSLPKAETLLVINELTGCDLKWLMTGEGQPFDNKLLPAKPQTLVVAAPAFDVLGNTVDTDEFVYIPRYDAHAAAGYGRFNHNETPLYTMAFRRDWIENFIDTDPANLFVIGVVGDSMEGVLSDHDTILVNEALTRPDNGLFIVRINESIIVKHIQVMPGRKLLVKSANEAYEPFTIDLNDEDLDMQILGKVVWFGRLVK